MKIEKGQFGPIKGGCGNGKVTLYFENNEQASKFIEFVNTCLQGD